MDVRHYLTLDSTNDEARRLAGGGEAGPLWVVADSQTGGRGRRGRSWVSKPGNLFTTLLIQAPTPNEACSQLSFVAALAVSDTVASLAPSARVTLKWPNDILLEGRKVAGILLESSGREGLCKGWVAVGMGINLAHFPIDAAFPAIAVASVTGAAPDRDAVLAGLDQSWQYWFAIWRESGFEPLRQAWLARVAGLGDPIVARLGNRDLEGVFQDLDGDGALILRQAGGALVRVTAGDVFFRS